MCSRPKLFRSDLTSWFVYARLAVMFNVELFIDAVKERPALYDRSHKLYHKKDNKARLWEQIGQVMFPDWPNLDHRERFRKEYLAIFFPFEQKQTMLKYAGLLMQKKWKSLKDCFNRELRLQKLCCYNPKRKQYEFYKRLSFLLNRKHPPQETLYTEEVIVKTETPEDVQQSTELSCSQSPLQEPPHSQQPPKKKIALDVENVRDIRKSRIKKSEAEDSDRLFLMSFVKDLNKLPLSTKYWVKMKFSEIMHQAAMNLGELQKADYKEGSHVDKNGDIECMS